MFPHHGSNQQTWLQSDSYRQICRANFTTRHNYPMSNQLTSLHNTRSPAQVPITNRQKDRGCSLLPIPGLQPENHRDREREREREKNNKVSNITTMENWKRWGCN